MTSPLPGSLRPVSFKAHDIAISPYVANFAVPRGGLQAVGTYRVEPVDVEIPGGFGYNVRGQAKARDITLRVGVRDGSVTRANIEQLQAWFSPTGAAGWLVAHDSDDNERRILCRSLGLEPMDAGSGGMANWIVTLHAADGRWQAVDEDDDDQTLGAGMGETLAWTQTNDGTDDTPFVFTITPGSAKASDDSYTKRRWLPIANRSEDEVDDTESDGYPVMVADLTALSITPGDDVRVFNGALELRRWIDGNDRVWVNLHLRPRKVATLAANINDSVTSLLVNNVEGFDKDNFYDSGFFKIDNETIQYSGRVKYDAGTLTRGSRGSTAAAHTAGATLYWVEHDYLYLLYDKDTPGDPPDGDDYEPLIDMDAGDNEEHFWADEFYNEPGSHRSRGWQRRSTEAGSGAEHVRQYAAAGLATFENELPAAGKPALNDAVIPLPIPAVGPIVLDATVGLSLLLRGYVSDREQYESRLISQCYTETPLSAESFSLPERVGRLRLNAAIDAIFGDLSLDDTSTDTATAVSGHFTVYKIVLDQDTLVNAFIAHHASAGGGTSFVALYRNEVDENTGRDKLSGGSIGSFQGTLPATTPDWVVYTPLGPSGSDPAFYLTAGTYWLALTGGTIYTHHDSRTNARSYLGEIDTTAGPPTTQVDAFDQTPLFAVISYDAEPQADAVLDNGDTAEIANVHITLDPTRTPKVDVGAEDDVYLLDETLENGTNGDYLQMFFPITVGEGLQFDTGRRLITDLETGLLVPWVRQASSARWPHLAPGANDLTWSGDGVTALAYAAAWNALRL